MEKKKEYAVSYYGGHVTAWLCVAAAILGIMYLLLGRGGGTKSMMVACFSLWSWAWFWQRTARHTEKRCWPDCGNPCSV